MNELITNRKFKILLENNAEVNGIIVGKAGDTYIIVETDDLSADISGSSEEEVLSKAQAVVENSALYKNMAQVPVEWFSEEYWVADDDELNLSIFNLIDYKPNISQEQLLFN